MADREKVRRRKRLKREQKRREHAKRERQREQTLAWATGPAQCYMTENWVERGMANVFILREGPHGKWVFAGFLIDQGCIGLKDTMSEDQYTPEDFREILEESATVQELAPISLDEARGIVTSAVRWTRMHQFRLPRGWEKAASIFGGVGDTEAADISMFGRDGGLYYHGLMRDLVSRLTTESLEEFVARPGVQVASAMEPQREGDDDVLGALQAAIVHKSERLADAVRKWCFRTGRKPEQSLDVAGRILMIALLATAQEDRSPGLIHTEPLRQRALELAEENDQENPGEPSVRPAVEQVIAFVRSSEGQEIVGEMTPDDE